jgi:hypothetical protein
MKRTIRLLAIIFTLSILAIFVLFIFVDNPYIDFVKSSGELNKSNSCGKIKFISLLEFENQLLGKPNSIFYVFTYYCGPCRKTIINGKDFDSAVNKSKIYISVDNSATSEKLCELVNKNKDIKLIYFINDEKVKGTHFERGELIHKLIQKKSTVKIPLIGYPYSFSSNNNGVIDSSYF